METEGRWGRRGERLPAAEAEARALVYGTLHGETGGRKGGLFREGGRKVRRSSSSHSIRLFATPPRASVRPTYGEKREKPASLSFWLQVHKLRALLWSLIQISNCWRDSRRPLCKECCDNRPSCCRRACITGRRPHGLTEVVFRFRAR